MTLNIQSLVEALKQFGAEALQKAIEKGKYETFHRPEALDDHWQVFVDNLLGILRPKTLENIDLKAWGRFLSSTLKGDFSIQKDLDQALLQPTLNAYNKWQSKEEASLPPKISQYLGENPSLSREKQLAYVLQSYLKLHCSSHFPKKNHAMTALTVQLSVLLRKLVEKKIVSEEQLQCLWQGLEKEKSKKTLKISLDCV